MSLEDDLLRLERQVLDDAGGNFFAAMAELRRMLAANLPGIQAKIIALVIPRLETAAQVGVVQAHAIGGTDTLDAVETADVVPANAIGDAQMRLDQGVPASLSDPLTGLDAFLVGQKSKALTLLTSGAPVEEALGPLFQAETTARRQIVSQINEAGNQAVLTVGDAVKMPMVFQSERDACVYCLGLAGEVVQRAGDPFPLADLYADGPLSKVTYTQPPIHGHCRCTLAVLVDESYAVALRREAQRSILRGFSLQSESNSVRVKAAARLLERNPDAPKSVISYARRAVRDGRFPRGRDVPAGGPRLVT